MNRIFIGFACCWLLAGATLANIQPEVSNLVAARREATDLIDVSFDIADVDGEYVHVSLWYSVDGGVSWGQECLTVTGDVGPEVVAAAGLSVTWDAGSDFPDYLNTDIFLRVYADDGTGEVLPGFVMIPPESVGIPISFSMGDTLNASYITPHQVTLTRRFSMAATEVTNAQYVIAVQWAFNRGFVTASSSSVHDALDGSTVSLLPLYRPECKIIFDNGVFSTDEPDLPVARMSWEGAVAYCDWLSLQDRLPRAYDHSTWLCNNDDPYGATGYRLPTEAEWELACRAGTTTYYHTGMCLDSWTEANYDGNWPLDGCPNTMTWNHLIAVSSHSANDWGLFDMHGNGMEWCNDWWIGDYTGDETDPIGPASASQRILRSGSYNSYGPGAASASRLWSSPGATQGYYCFRPVKTIN